MERSKYLQLAEKTILARGVPLTGTQIIDFAKKYDLLPFESYGTVKKTLQARIAEDISRYRTQSRFIRTGIGTYFLRQLADQETIFGRVQRSHERVHRKKPEHPHRILCVPRTLVNELSKASSWDAVREVLNYGQYQYQSEIPSALVPVVTGVALLWRGRVFSYRVGVHTHFNDTTGLTTVHLRKYLDEYDLDLFETDGSGATSSTARAALPVLAPGKRSRLENGRLRPSEEVRFYQVASLLENKQALPMPKCSGLLLSSDMDLSNIYDDVPETHRRLEINDPMWVDIHYANDLISDPQCTTVVRRSSLHGRVSEATSSIS